MPLEGFVTQPNPAAPGAPADPTTAPTTAPGAPATTAPTQPTSGQGQDPNAPIDFDKLDPNVKAYIASLRQEAGNYRQAKTAAEQAAAMTTSQLNGVLAALGRNPDGSALVDPEAAAEELRARAERAENQVWASNVRLGIHRLAAKYGADPDLLLDSQSFQDTLDDLVEQDSTSPQFLEQLGVKIREGVVANPNLRARSGPARVGADITGSGGGGNERPKSLREAYNRKNT